MITNVGNEVSFEKFKESLPKKALITISTSEWENNTCIKSILGVRPDSTVIVSPIGDSFDDYYASVVRITAQSNNALTFVCDDVPTSNLNIEVVIMKTLILGGGLKSLSLVGDWANNQYKNSPIDYTGLTFTATYNDGNELIVTPTSISPEYWDNISGTQICSFNYTEAGITVSVTKDATVKNIIPTRLVITGDWANSQTEGSAPDVTGLSFTAIYVDGSSRVVTPTVSPSTWDTGIGNQTATFSYTDEGATVTATKSANMTYTYSTVADGHGSVSGSGTYVYNSSESQTANISYTPDSDYYLAGWTTSGGSDCSASGNILTINAGCYGNIVATASFELIAPTSLVVTGDWDNTQYVDSAVDYTGLIFTVTYNDGTTASVTPTSVSPSIWGSTVGTQSCTFIYEENGFSVSASKSASVQAIVPTSLSITGDWTNTQYTEQSVDYTGLVFTAAYSNGSSASVTPTSLNPSTWSNTVGTQSCTFSYTEDGITVSASKSASVINPLSIPLTLQARETGNISITKDGDPGTIYYSKNSSPQAELSSDVNVPVIAGDKVSFYRTLSGDLDYNNFFKINCTNNCYVYGNVMSLYDKDNYVTSNTIQYTYAFNCLFFGNSNIDINESIGKLILPATTLAANCYKQMFYECTGLTNIPSNLLPVTTLSDYCYSNMFNGCTSLTTAPELPATTLASYCYYEMFQNCTSLTTAPVLSSTTLANSCYYGMFQGCTGLTTAPELPATTLASYCYYEMFARCTSLTTAPILPATTLAQTCYRSMFQGCTGLTTAPTLPATTLTQNCYQMMFQNCTSLTTAPVLSSTTLANSCYYGMFQGCTGLTTAPALPATTLKSACYYNMFYGCTSLTTAPTLSSTTLAGQCYTNMFYGCTSLTTAPALPATTLKSACYYNMFSGCTSLTTAPALPATTLETVCYVGMFSGCRSLTSITCLATDISASSCTLTWVSGVSSSGTFYKNSAMSSWTTGNDGIPSGWTVLNA